MGTFLRVHLNRVMRLQFREKAAARTRQVGVMVFVRPIEQKLVLDSCI